MNFDYLLSGFPQAQANFKALAGVKTRTFDFGKFQIKAQFNPARALSSGATLDTKSIEARPCFLCAKNRPALQKTLPYNERFEICVNPFPILNGHLTIISKEHTGQKITPYYKDMLSLAKDLSSNASDTGYVILYNGAKCGASAPDHLHFQAVFKGQLPLENDVASRTSAAENATAPFPEALEGNIYLLNDYLRTCYIVEAENLENAQHLFAKLYAFLQSKNIDETMINVFCWYDASASLSNRSSATLTDRSSATLTDRSSASPTDRSSASLTDRWTTAVFPRKAHRPAQFFAQGEDFMMISPGAIDMAGMLVLPREKDFERMSIELIKDVMSQVGAKYFSPTKTGRKIFRQQNR